MHIELIKDHFDAQLVFDRFESSANIFDQAVLEELERHLDTIQKDKSIERLIIRSAKKNIFIAGADLHALAKASEGQMSELIELGQRVFDQLASLTATTVAAIHGACVGGGYELALACDYRVASDAKSTRIGLPETQLGILPAWGGSTRLPALIGLDKALPLILGGKLLTAQAAHRKGMVDGVCPAEHLLEYAARFAAKPKRKEDLHFLVHNPASVALIRKKAHDSLQEKTHGHYPALHRALKVVCDSVRCSHGESLQHEAQAIRDLIQGPEARELIRLFFLSEKSKKLKLPDTTAKALPNTAVIGSGVMGAGIAYWLSTRGHKVLLKDINDQALAKGMQSIEASYSQSVKRHILSKTEARNGLDHITATTKPVSMRDRDLIIEAATEDLALKKKIFGILDAESSPDTILATNTSALPIHALSEVISHPERLIGIHFFNPVARMKLVEVVETESTSPETLASAIRFVQSIGKLPVVVKDSPGFLVNRILVPYLVRAAEMFLEGTEAERIDRAMLDFGMPMGPLRLLDEVGLDVGLHVASTLAAAFPDRMTVPSALERLIAEDHLGKKSGSGFYLYGKHDPEPNPAALELQGDSPQKNSVQNELALLMSQEAALCLEEGIARSAEDIDFAMVMGTGYAPFRGGPLRHSDNAELLETTFYPHP